MATLFLIIILILYVIALGFVAHQVFSTISGGKSSIPLLRTSPEMVHRIIESGVIEIGDNVVDLGSGLGDIVFPISKELDVSVTGIEINWVLFSLSHIRRFFGGFHEKVWFVRSDMLKRDLSGYDVVIIFGIKGFIEKYLLSKLERELGSGAIVVSNTFRLNSDKFEEEKHILRKGGFNKEFYVYKKHNVFRAK